MAARHGYTEICRLLLHRGADSTCIYRSILSWPQIQEMTPLGCTVFSNDETARILLENGVDVELKSNQRALHCAAYHKRIDIVSLLTDWGLDVNKNNGGDFPPIFTAIQRGWADRDPDVTRTNLKTSILKFLIEKGASNHVINKEMKTLLLFAVNCGETSCVDLLLEHGANIHATFDTCIEEFVSTSRQDKAEFFDTPFEHVYFDGCRLEDNANNDETPLQIAARVSHPEMVDLLLKRGATDTEVDRLGRTPLALATQRTQRIESRLEETARAGKFICHGDELKWAEQSFKVVRRLTKHDVDTGRISAEDAESSLEQLESREAAILNKIDLLEEKRKRKEHEYFESLRSHDS